MVPIMPLFHAASTALPDLLKSVKKLHAHEAKKARKWKKLSAPMPKLKLPMIIFLQEKAQVFLTLTNTS